MKINQKVKCYEDDVSQYQTGDVLKCWNANQDNADYVMIASVGAEYRTVTLNGVKNGLISFNSAYDIPLLIDDLKCYYKHIQRVQFEGTDLGRKVGNY